MRAHNHNHNQHFTPCSPINLVTLEKVGEIKLESHEKTNQSKEKTEQVNSTEDKKNQWHNEWASMSNEMSCFDVCGTD